MKQGRLDGYLFQRALWQRKIGRDEYAKPLFAPAVDIRARKQPCIRLVKNSMGAEVVCSLAVYCAEDVKPGDRIDGAEVINVREYVDGRGCREGTRAHL